MDSDEQKLRVFVSYSHDDETAVTRLVDVLARNGLRPMHDADFASGSGLTHEIRAYIAHSHVFLPVITESASRRGWVHQEIGYAIALNIPVLPVVIGEGLPQAMIQDRLAVRLRPDLSDLPDKLSLRRIEKVASGLEEEPPLYECAVATEARSDMLARYARTVLAMEMTGRVRHRGALSSFSIPRQDITHPAWDLHYGSAVARGSIHHRGLLRDERAALCEHAAMSGCRLIIDPTQGAFGPEVRRSRLGCLLDFLESDEVADVQVAIDARMPPEDNLIMVGSYFCAQSVAGSVEHGYRQTIFTRHAPTLARSMQRFDRKFAEVLAEAGWAPEASRHLAAEEIRRVMAAL